jgi:hypothetical protein
MKNDERTAVGNSQGTEDDSFEFQYAPTLKERIGDALNNIDDALYKKIKKIIKARQDKYDKKHNPEGLEIADNTPDDTLWNVPENLRPIEIDVSDIANALTKRDIGRKL